MKIHFIQKIAKASFLAAIIFCTTVTVQAQNNNPGPKLGLKGGVNFSQLFVDQINAEDENMKVGYHVGVFTKLAVSDFLAIQPEVLFTTAGSKITYGGSNLASALGIREGEVRFNLNYIQVPVALVANIGPFSVHAGPYVAYLVGANVTDLRSSDLSSDELIDLNRDNFNKIDYGVVGGLGFDVGAVTVGARYNYGLREIGNTGIGGALTNNSRNGVAQIYLGFGL